MLHMLPLIPHQEVVKKENTCAKKSVCSKQKPAEEKKCCDDNKGCNPFVPCSMGSCCYIVENFYAQPTPAIGTKEKNVLTNDNTLQSALSECWQPPETHS